MEDRPRLRPGPILLSLLLLSPLVWAPGYGYDGVRRPLALLLVALLLGLGARQGLLPRRGRDPLFGSALSLLALSGLSLAGATTPSEGFVPLLLLFAGVSLFAVLRGGLVPRDFVLQGAPVVVAIAGLASGAVGILLPSVSPEGNSNYTGALAGMLLPATAAFALAGRGFVGRVLPALSAAVLAVLLLMSQSRGGWVGAVAGLFVVVGTAAGKRLPGRTVATAGLVVLAALPFLLPGARLRSEAGKEGVAFRLEAWKSAARMVAVRPLLGVGPGNFAVEYPRFRSEAEVGVSMAHSEGRFVEAEDPHSSWVAAGVETGLAGLAAFAAVAFFAARSWLRAVRGAVDPGTLAVLAGLGGGAAAFMISGFFNTLTFHVSPTLTFWAFVGMIDVLGRPEEEPSAVRAPDRALALTAALAALAASCWAGAWAYSDWAFTRGMATADPASRETMMLKALGGDPRSARAHLELGRSRAAQGQPGKAVEAGRRALDLRPHSVPALNNLAVWILASRGDGAEAERLLRHAAGLAPGFYLSHFNLGSLLMQKKAWPAARESFDRAVSCSPQHGPSLCSLGECLAREGKVEEAVVEFRKARAAKIDVGQVLRQNHPDLARDPRLSEFIKNP